MWSESEFGYHVVAPDGHSQTRMASSKVARNSETEYREAGSIEVFRGRRTTRSTSNRTASNPLSRKKFKLEIRTARVTRNAAPDATGALASRNFLNALFSAVRDREEALTEPSGRPQPARIGSRGEPSNARTPPHWPMSRTRSIAAWIADKAAELARKARPNWQRRWRERKAPAGTGRRSATDLARSAWQPAIG